MYGKLLEWDLCTGWLPFLLTNQNYQHQLLHCKQTQTNDIHIKTPIKVTFSLADNKSLVC